MSIEKIFSDKTQDKRYDIKDIKEVGKQVKDEYSEKTGELKTDIKDKLDILKDDIELKAIKEANEKTRRLPNNQNKIKSIQDKIKQIKPESTSTDSLSTITKALQLISGSDETLKNIVKERKEIKNNVLFFKRTGENDWEILKGLCTECTTDTFSKETLKAVCYLQAMSQDYFNTDYGVDGVVGGNTLRALDAALQLMVPSTDADKTKTSTDANKETDIKKLTDEEQKKTDELRKIKEEIKTETNSTKKVELQKKEKTLVEEVTKIMKKIEEANKINETKDKKETKETGTVDVETPEVLKLKKDISEHFTLNGKEISREKEMANTISVKDGKYVLAIKGYTNIQFSYQIEKQIDGKTFINLAKSEGNISKGLLKYNIKEQTVDVASKGKIDITTELNQDKTKENINEQLKDNNKDGDKIPDYKVSAVTENKLTLDYTRNNTEKEKKPITESFELDLDENKNITPDSKGNGKFSQWQEKKGKKTYAEYTLDNKYQLPKGEVLTRYAQNNGEGKITIINNIQKFEGNGSAKSIYPEHTEMTDVVTNAIKEDFLTNKIERTFTGTLNARHQEDFANNRKISKGKTGYELQLSFVANNGKNTVIALPFTENTASNAERTYAFTNSKLTKNIDGIVYDIVVTNINNVPNIKMQENIKETLSEAEKNTKIKLESDIFSGKKEKRINNGNTYNVENLGLSQGPIALETKGGFKRELLLGEKKEGENIVVAGTKIGEAFFDQDYKLIHVDMKAKDKNEEIDFTKKKNEIEITKAQEDTNGSEKNIFLAPSIKGKTLTLNLVEPEDLKKPHRETTEKYKERLREEKELIFINLRNLSTTLNSKNFLLPTTETDESKYTNPILGPDNNGVYDYKLVNKKEDSDAQHIYLQIQGTEAKLCSNDGKKTLNKVFVREPDSKDYYTLSVENKKLAAKKIDKDQQQKIPEISSSTINYMSQKVSIQVPKDKIILLNGGTDTYTYGAGGKELITVYIKDKKLDTTKYTKKPDTGLLPANNDTERVNFGSYQNYFSLAGDQSLGVSEGAYETAFKETYGKNAEKDAGKTIAQVKMRSSKDGKYYYDYMEVKGSEKNISLSTLKGVEKTKTILKERLAQLILLKSLKISSKGDQLRGIKLNTTNTQTEAEYLKTGTAEFKLSLTANDATTSSPEMTLKVEGDSRKLTNNENITLNQQKINAKLTRKNDLPYIKLDLKEQKADKKSGGTENSSSTPPQNTEQTKQTDTPKVTPTLIPEDKTDKSIVNPTIIEDQTENPIVVNEIPKDQEQLTTIKGKTATEISTNKEPSLIIEQSKSLTEVTDAEGEKKIISAAKDLVAKASQKNAEIAKTGPKDEELATAIDELNLFISYNETVNQIKETSQEIQKLNASKTRLKTNKTELQAAKFRFNELSKNLSVTNKEIQTRTGEKVTISNFSARIKESYSRLKNLYETTSNKTEVIPNAINVDAKKIDTQPQKIETPNEVAKVTTFSIENKELRTIITDLLPKKELNGPKTPEISVDLVINTVNKIQDKEARETIQDLLKQGIVILAQEHMGMRQESRFSDNRATGILDQETLNRMQLPRLLRKGKDVIPFLSTDTVNIYNKFLSGEIKNDNKPYVIVSKQDGKIYAFDHEHRLISKNNVLLGPKGDIPPSKKVGPKTPGGEYIIDAIDLAHEGFAKPSTYLQLKPTDREYFNPNFSIGIHTYYTEGQTNRAKLLEKGGTSRRETDGCINTPVAQAGPIYDKLVIGSHVIVTKEI